MLTLILAVSVAVIISFTCSLTEAALYAVPWSAIEKIRNDGRPVGEVLFRLRSNVEKPIAAILTLNTVANTAGSAVAGWFGGIGDHFDKVADLQQENDDLRAQVADLERQLRQAQKESEENQRLRDLLELQSQRRDLKTVSARVTERSVSNWASTLTLTW